MIWHLLPLSGAGSFPLSGTPFLHACPDLDTLLAVANAFYSSGESSPLVALGIDSSRVDVRLEPASPAPPPGVDPSVLFPHVYGPVTADAVVATRYARRDPSGRYVSFDVRPATAESLDLLPHPEGGWFRETWRSPVSFTPDGYSGPRAAATLIYFLLRPGEESRWHMVRSDEIWLWHSGGPLTLLVDSSAADALARDATAADATAADATAALTRDASARDATGVTLGPDLSAGQFPHYLVPGGTWQSAHPATDAEVLVSCVVAPGFDFADFTAT